MTENLTDRIEIINSYNLLIRSRNKATKSRIRINYIIIGITLPLSILFLGFIFYAAIAGLFGIEARMNWEESALTVLLSISFVFDLSNRLYNFILLKHLQNIENAKVGKVETHLNADLETTITKLNEPERNILVLVLGALIVISSLLQQTDSSQIWNYFKIPTLLFFIFWAARTTRIFKKLRSNIAKSEDQLLNPDIQINPL